MCITQLHLKIKQLITLDGGDIMCRILTTGGHDQIGLHYNCMT